MAQMLMDDIDRHLGGEKERAERTAPHARTSRDWQMLDPKLVGRQLAVAILGDLAVIGDHSVAAAAKDYLAALGEPAVRPRDTA